MKKVVFVSLGLALVGHTSAKAADVIMPVYQPAPIMSPVSVYDWTGFYAGVNAGYGGGTFRHPFSFNNTELLSLNISAGGFVGGVQAGYNAQFDNWVAGVEADAQWTNIRGELGIDLGVPGSIDLGTRVDWFGTLRARLGYAVADRFMVYGTGGLAYGRMTSYATGGGGFAGLNESTSSSKFGWTLGGGAEYAFTDNMSLKTEYLYTDLGRSNVATFNLGPDTFTIDRRVSFHTVRAGLNFHF